MAEQPQIATRLHTTPPVAIQLLGGFSVEVTNGRVGLADFERRSAAELVQLLALAPKRRLHRERVLDSLWPVSDGEPQQQSRRSNQLHKAASYARKALRSAEAVVLRGDAVSLFPNTPVSVDVDLVERVDLDDPQSLATALAAYRGDLLPHEPYAEWLLATRDRLRLQHIETLRRAGRWQEIIELSPTDEASHVALMQEALNDGQALNVIRRFEVLRDVLDHHLRVEPSGEARALHVAAKQQLERAPQGGSASGDRASDRTVLRAVLVLTSVDVDGVETGGPTDPHPFEPTTSVERHGGTILPAPGAASNGSTVVTFPSVRQAVDAGRELRAQSVGPGPAIVIDLGDVRQDDAATTGTVIERACSLARLTLSSQMLCTRGAAAALGSAANSTIDLRHFGIVQLPDGPPVALVELDPSSPGPGSPGHRLGPFSGQTHGREQERLRIAEVIDEARLVTITGPGGIGKTHLATQVCGDPSVNRRRGAWLCQLAATDDDAAVPQELLTTIGGQQQPNVSVTESIVRTLAPSDAIIVLDNCEHRLAAVRRLCRAVLDRCPMVTIVVTSREPLGLRGEATVRLGPLDRDGATALFRAEAGRHGTTIGHDAAAVERICKRLDDLPLAVQLAAAQARSLSLSAIEDMLDDRLDRFRGPESSGGSRHETLRALIAWSVDHLDPVLSELLLDLSIFVDRFDLDAAVAIGRRRGASDAHVVGGLDGLVTRSLLLTDDEGGQRRYRMLGSVRLFVRQQVEARSKDAAAQRHQRHFIGRAETSNDMLRDRAAASFRRFNDDWEDIRAAFGFAMARGDHRGAERIITATGLYAMLTHRGEILDWCNRLDDDSGSRDSGPDLAATWSFWLAERGAWSRGVRMAGGAKSRWPNNHRLPLSLGSMYLLVGELETARHWLDQVRRSTAGDALLERAFALALLAVTEQARSTPAAPAIGATSAELQVLAANGDPVYSAFHHLAAGIDQRSADRAAAVHHLQRSIELADEMQLQTTSAAARATLASMAVDGDDRAYAADQLLDALEWLAGRGFWLWVLALLPGAALVIKRYGRPDVATSLLATRHPRAVRHRATDSDAAFDRDPEIMAELRREHPTRFETWWRIGRALDPAQAATLARRVLTELLDEERQDGAGDGTA